MIKNKNKINKKNKKKLKKSEKCILLAKVNQVSKSESSHKP